MSLLTSSCCRSRPLIPGSRTSRTRQLRASRGASAKISCAEENACTFSPADRSRLLRLSRIDDSSSITQTNGLFSFMGLPLKNQRPEVSQILLDLGPRTLRRMAQDSQSLSRPDKVSKRLRSHLLHDVTAMDLNGDLAGTQFCSGLFVEEPRGYFFHHLPLARRQ